LRLTRMPFTRVDRCLISVAVIGSEKLGRRNPNDALPAGVRLNSHSDPIAQYAQLSGWSLRPELPSGMCTLVVGRSVNRLRVGPAPSSARIVHRRAADPKLLPCVPCSKISEPFLPSQRVKIRSHKAASVPGRLPGSSCRVPSVTGKPPRSSVWRAGRHGILAT